MRHPMFTEEHEMFRKQARNFVEKEIRPNVEKWEEEEFFSNDVFRKLGGLGYLGAHFPEDVGGGGGDYLYWVILCEELARGGAGGVGMGVSVAAGMALPPIEKFGSPEIKKKFLEPALRGELIPALGITEPNAGSDVASLRTNAYKDGDEWVINGSKIFITNGVRCDFVLLVVRTDKESKGPSGISLIIVEKDRPGFEVSRKLNKMGMKCSDTAELVFENCRAPLDNLVGDEGKGFKQIMWELQGERITACAGTVARAERALEDAIMYARERVQFGRPISAFQVTQHKLAEMASKVEMCRQFTYAIAASFMRGEYPVKEISMAKLMSSRLMFEVIDDALQIHGGYGYMMEYNVQRYWRDMRLTRIGGGTDEIMREVIATEMGLKERKKKADKDIDR